VDITSTFWRGSEADFRTKQVYFLGPDNGRLGTRHKMYWDLGDDQTSA
jgi:hypothetical protein